MSIFNIFVVLVEEFYFSIPINEILQNKKYKQKIIVYLKILILDVLGLIIFQKSMYRYLFSFISMYLSIFAFENKSKTKNKLLDFFIIPILFFIKAIIEYLTYLIIFKYVSYEIFVMILEFFSILFILSFKNKYFKIYSKLIEKLNNNKEFYYRYLILIIFNLFIIFLIFNLIKIKEVL